MQMVIDIPEEMYNMACKYPEMVLAGYPLCIKNGTPLPDGAEILTKEAYSDLCLRASKTVTDAIDLVKIKEYPDSYNDVPETNIGKIGKDTNVTTTDYISREAAIVALDNRMQSLENVDMQIAMGFAKGIIHELPPVTLQPKMGQWLIKRVGDYDHAICSVCGDDSYLSPEWDALELYRYCPNCGSKMSEVEK